MGWSFAIARPWRATWFTLAFFATACGGPTAEREPRDESAGGETIERAPRAGLALTRPLALHGSPHGTPRPVDGGPRALLQTRATTPPSAAAAARSYERAAPATVIVRTPRALGAGAVVGRGLVLTSAHLVAGATRVDFRRRVRVEYGAIRDGVMVPDGEERDAWVLSIDRVRGLALLRVDRPAGVRPLTLAEADPVAGMMVTALGHGNAGLAWRAHRGAVASTGRLEELRETIDRLCARSTPDSVTRCSEAREILPPFAAGLTLLTSCQLAPAELGGPLVNERGELVGLNEISLRDEAGVISHVHVHVRELREFLSTTVPNEAPPILPTPWLNDAREVRALDQDADGQWDSLMASGIGRSMALLLDLDQDTPDFEASESRVRLEQESFDAELAIVSEADISYVWYDTSADGRLDTVMVVPTRDDATHSYRVDESGVPTLVPGGSDSQAISPSWIPRGGRARFERILHDHVETTGPAPSPTMAMRRSGRLLDADDDGRPDAILADRVFIQMLTLDLDGNTLGGIGPEELDSTLRNEPDLEATFGARGARLWAYYDTDDDGTFDHGLRTAPHSPIVTAIVPLSAATEPVEAENYLGTMLIRPCLAGPFRGTLERSLRDYFPAGWTSPEPEHCGLPEPYRHADATILPVRVPSGWEDAVVAYESRGRSTIALDVDQSTFRGREGRDAREAGLEATVRSGGFSADLAVVSLPGATWVYYDTDFDGEWDLCLVRVLEGDTYIRNAFRRVPVDDHHGYRVAPEQVVGPLFRPSLFAEAHPRPRQGQRIAEALTTVLAAIFDPSELER